MRRVYRYGAVGEEGCEFVAKTEQEVKAWIYTEIMGEGHSTEPVDKEYYQICAYTKEEFDNLKEI